MVVAIDDHGRRLRQPQRLAGKRPGELVEADGLALSQHVEPGGGGQISNGWPL